MFFSVFLSLLLLNCLCQECLLSPDHVAHFDSSFKDAPYSGKQTNWIYDPFENAWRYTLTLEGAEMQYTVDDILTTFTTRVYDGTIPGKTFIMRRGNHYIITLVNALGNESPNNPVGVNIIKDPNTTNLHTHGLHISPQPNSDDVLIEVDPGQSQEYNWRLPCDHTGGIHWYHPHHHGSTTIQVGGGAAGAIIIEDDQTQEGLPNWLVDMESLTLVIQQIKLWKLEYILPDANDLNQFTGMDRFTLVNGQIKPDICLLENVWLRLRILHVDIQDEINIEILPKDRDPDVRCQLRLIARDGVLVHGEYNEVPREVDGMYFSPSSRGEVAIVCPYNDGIGFDVIAKLVVGDTIIATISVSPGKSDYDELQVFNPLRPSYHQSLLEYEGPWQEYPWMDEETVNFWSVRIDITTLNRIPWIPGYVHAYIDVNTVSQWDVGGAGGHPFHTHVNHFQTTLDSIKGPANWNIRGDWIDTLDSSQQIRFYSHAFGGKIVLHCHILEHEDEGAMGVIQVNGGCDYDYSTIDTAEPGQECIYNSQGCYDNTVDKKLIGDINIQQNGK